MRHREPSARRERRHRCSVLGSLSRLCAARSRPCVCGRPAVTTPAHALVVFIVIDCSSVRSRPALFLREPVAEALHALHGTRALGTRDGCARRDPRVAGARPIGALVRQAGHDPRPGDRGQADVRAQHPDSAAADLPAAAEQPAMASSSSAAADLPATADSRSAAAELPTTADSRSAAADPGCVDLPATRDVRPPAGISAAADIPGSAAHGATTRDAQPGAHAAPTELPTGCCYCASVASAAAATAGVALVDDRSSSRSAVAAPSPWVAIGEASFVGLS